MKLLDLTLVLLTISTSAFAERIGGTRIRKGNDLAGIITDSRTGKGIKGVAVSDGYGFTLTDKRGVYQMKANPGARTVWYRTPSSYKMAQDESGAPAFYAYRNSSAKVDRHDFVLEPLDRQEDDITLLIMADPQCQSDFDVNRLRTETIPDARKTIEEGIASGRYSNVYGIGLGDIIYDNLDIWAPMRESFRSLSYSGGSVPIYNIPGNHDHSNKVDNAYDAIDNYIRFFGPQDYSFDRGQVHFIFMDDIIFTGSQPDTKAKPWNNCLYDCGFTDEQMSWLLEDLSLVEDKESKMVVFCTHAPFRQGSKKGGGNVNHGRHYDDVLSALTGFKTAEILIGHTHYPETYIHKDYVCKGGGAVREHVFGSMCGAWWHTNICVDGTPNGYAVYQIGGTVFTDEVARFTGLPESCQMRVYDGNQVYNGTKGVEFKWEDDLKGKFIATVWYADPENWKVEFIQDGVARPMEQVSRRQRDWCAYSYFINENGRNPENKSYWTNRPHYWTIPAASGDPSSEKGWTIRATHTVPGSGKVHVYSCDKIQKDYVGL